MHLRKREEMSRKGYFNFEFYQGQSDIINFLCFRVIWFFFMIVITLDFLQ